MEIRKVDIVVLTVIPQELAALKAALGIRDIPDNRSRTQDSKTIYLHGKLCSEPTKRSYNLALGCIGSAGNYDFRYWLGKERSLTIGKNLPASG